MNQRQPIERTEEAFERRHALVMDSIDKYHTYLEGYLYGLCKNHHTAEDLLQELWIFVINKFREEHISQLGILRRKASQLFIDYYRKQKRAKVIIAEEIPEVPVSKDHHREPANESEERALEDSFWEEFPDIDLSDQQKQALWLHVRLQKTYKEIEEELGVATSTIGDWIKLARTKIADYINKQL